MLRIDLLPDGTLGEHLPSPTNQGNNDVRFKTGERKLAFKLMPKIQNIKGLEKGSKNVNCHSN